MKNKIAVTIAVIMAITIISGAGILVAANPGTQEDPLITLSYLTSIFRPQIMEEIRKAEQELSDRFNERITQLESQLQGGQGGSSASDPGSADEFSVVTLSRGQSLICSVGTEIMLRIGSATGFGNVPVLVNYTTGAALSSGASLTLNHMYLVTIEGNGIRATDDTVRVLVRGNYTIS